jgi:hypothetical protein
MSDYQTDFDKPFLNFLSRYRYQLLLIGIIQHLFIGIFVRDFDFYVSILWPVNMVILAILASGLFLDTQNWVNRIKFLLFISVILSPLGIPFWGTDTLFMIMLNITYVLFFGVLFTQVFKDMIYAKSVNMHMIIASICGFLLLIEIFVFTAHIFIHLDPHSYSSVDLSNPPSIYTDLVYYCAITLTTIGYGDITPLTHHTKLIAAFFGITGQFYQILFLGIVISKFTNGKN